MTLASCLDGLTLRLARIGLGLSAMVLAACVLLAPVPALAQDEVSEARLRKIEAEIRALQRNVFPGGDGRFFEPQITRGANNGDNANGAVTTSAPSTTALTDILARLDAMELQMQRLTARSEEQANRLSQMDERIAALENTSAPSIPVAPLGGGDDAIAPAPAEAAPAEVAPADTASDEPSAPAATATESNLEAMRGGESARDEQPAAPLSAQSATAPTAGPSPERLAAVQAIAKPQTNDPGDDEYSYGFRLWNAGFYPEARQQLSSYVEQYPNHSQITYGRNLLGRAFLDDGMPEAAARWFLRNYQADKTARRAPDSLLFLAEAMIALQDTRRACIALAEFGDTYPAVAAGRLSGQYETNRQKVSCS